jgi:hypothetical protein
MHDISSFDYRDNNMSHFLEDEVQAKLDRENKQLSLPPVINDKLMGSGSGNMSADEINQSNSYINPHKPKMYFFQLK